MKLFVSVLLVAVLILSVSTIDMVPSEIKCRNISKDCKRKARQGWCSKDQSYVAMGRKCRLSCQMCDKKSKVFDHDARCKRWKDLGFCEIDFHSIYMYRSCKYSCPKLVKAFTMGREEKRE